MKLKLLLLFAFSACLMLSCKKDTPPPDVKADIIFPDGQELNPEVSSAGENTVIKFKATKAWTAVVTGTETSWCTLSAAKGDAGDDLQITITTKANAIVDKRVAIVVLKSESVEKKITVTQKANLSPEAIITFPDAVFKKNLVERVGTDKEDPIRFKIDTNGDGEISLAEAQAVEALHCRYVEEGSLSSLEGIEYFTNLTDLNCYNNQITTLDLSKNTKLTALECNLNKLTSLDVSNNPKLVLLDCSPMNDASGNNLLTELILKTGQTIAGITSDRSTDWIPAETTISYK